MFNLGPMELIVLAIVGLIVLGPDRLPGLARDAGRMLRTLRDLAQGARTQLRDELGPEFADVDLRNLNPRTAIQRAVLGDDLDLGSLNPRTFLQDAILGPDEGVSLQKESGPTPEQTRQQPGTPAPYDPDAT